MGTLKSRRQVGREGGTPNWHSRQVASGTRAPNSDHVLLPDCLFLVWLPVPTLGQGLSGQPSLTMEAVCRNHLARVGSMDPGSIGGVVRGTQKQQQQADNW